MKVSELILIHLGLDQNLTYSKDELLDAREEYLYEESKFFSQRNFHLDLAKARIKKLSGLLPLDDLLGLNVQVGMSTNDFADLNENERISDLLRVYNQYESRVKLGLAQSRTFGEVIDWYKVWQQLFSSFAKSYIKLFEIEYTGDFSGGGSSRILKVNISELIEQLAENNLGKQGLTYYHVLGKQLNKPIAS